MSVSQDIQQQLETPPPPPPPHHNIPPVVMSQPESAVNNNNAVTTTDSQNMSQGYFSNSGDESERGLEAIKMHHCSLGGNAVTAAAASINASQCENIEIVREEDLNEEGGAAAAAAAEYLSSQEEEEEEDVSFLCFSWKRRKSARMCPGSRDRLAAAAPETSSSRT